MNGFGFRQSRVALTWVPISVAVDENIPPILATANAVTTAFKELVMIPGSLLELIFTKGRNRPTCDAVADLEPICSEGSCECFNFCIELPIAVVCDYLIFPSLYDGDAVVPPAKEVFCIVEPGTWEPQRDFREPTRFEETSL